jgi:hypothetical protein
MLQKSLNIQEDTYMAEAAKKGKGWHGNSRAHAEAGRAGGLARARNRKLAAQQ